MESFLSSRPKVDLLNSQSTWTIKTKVARALWKPFQIILFCPGPRFLSPARVAALRLFGADIGRRVLILGGVRVWCPWNLEIGDFSAVGNGVEIYNFGHVKIGELTVVSQYTYLCTASHRYEVPNMPLFWRPISIGAQAWLAAGVFVAPGVTIGEGAVVGARSVVVHDVPDWQVFAGNPARFIKDRRLSDGSDS
jgi:putative colanic acid biosynthesis acetyltransferase WcaF